MKSIFLLISLIAVTSFYAQDVSKSSKKYFNQYGQLIKEGDIKTNYSKAEIEAFQHLSYTSDDSELFLNPENISNDNMYIDCDIIWQDAIFGDCIGSQNNLIPFDLDNDGTIELIANSKINYDYAFWYILKYNNVNTMYEKVYISKPYEGSINKLIKADIHNDGQTELLLASGNLLEIISLEDMNTLQSIPLNDINSIVKILYDDADNDGEKEIVVSGMERLLLINPTTYEVESNIEINAGDFDIGNVDNDAELETVFVHGITLEINSTGGYFVQTDFRPVTDDPNGYIILSDIDIDGYKEAIIANPWHTIETFDIDISNPKYTINADLDIQALYTHDVNNDGIDDILYGDGQWGSIYAHHALNGALVWSIPNPEHGTTAIAISDFDNDGEEEIVWGAGCTSTGSDYLFFHDTINLQLEWQSPHIDGPFYAIEVADVDEDGQQEIITISFESESGYDSGILTIYDAQSKEIEFRSDGNFFNGMWEGVFNVEIGDFANDGDIDIVVAADSVYDGTIWVIDGDSHTIEAMQTSNVIPGFYASVFEDYDSDGVSEIILVADKLYIFNNPGLYVEWNSNSLGYDIPSDVLVGNVDVDSNKEIVACKGNVYCFDDINFTQYTSAYSGYTAIHMYDWDNDGNQEILAGTETGIIHVLDGLDLTITHIIYLNTGESVGAIDVIDVGDLGARLIVSTGEQLAYVDLSDDSIIFSQPLAHELGRYDALKFAIYDSGLHKSIFMGSVFSVIELDPTCAIESISVPDYEISKNEKLQIFPNPNEGTFSILNHSLPDNISCKLFSSTGKHIAADLKVERDYDDLYKIGLPLLNNGIYYFQVMTENKIFYAKIIVQ